MSQVHISEALRLKSLKNKTNEALQLGNQVIGEIQRKIDGKRLEAGQKYPLKAKNILALSKSCEFLVEIGDMKI